MTHGADKVRAQYGATGAGIKVGRDLQQHRRRAGRLPERPAQRLHRQQPHRPARRRPDPARTTAEGLAMCEVVQRIVPGAQIYYGTDVPGGRPHRQHRQRGTDGHEHQRRWRRTAARSSSTTFAFEDESPFQDSGPVAQAVDTVANNGVLYFSCAANFGNLDSMAIERLRGRFQAGRRQGLPRFQPRFRQRPDDELTPSRPPENRSERQPRHHRRLPVLGRADGQRHLAV